MEDREALRRYGPLVYRLAVAKVNRRDDADDVFQEVFLRYVRKQPSFQSEEHAKAWFIRVTINCARRHWRSQRRQPTPQEADVPVDSAEADVDLHLVLASLPAPYWEVVHLFYEEDLPVDTIARLLRRKPATVRTQLTRARALLRKAFKGDEPHETDL